jgi:hypothetical protein
MRVEQHPFCGLPHEDDRWHYVLDEKDTRPREDDSRRRLAPRYVVLPNNKQIPKWGPTKRDIVNGYRPGADCKGYFTTSKFQPNNNCYNYACNIATNSFAQPGRRHGKTLLQKGQTLNLGDVIAGAKADGLRLIGDASMSLPQALRSPIYLNGFVNGQSGHLVALLLSEAKSDIRWKGDYHWIRCDHPSGRHWSQKDGKNHVTNYDFRGNWIVNPKEASWTVNEGPPATGWGYSTHKLTSKVVTYSFAAWMFVPYRRVSII